MPSNKDISTYFQEPLGEGRYRCRQRGSKWKLLPNSGYLNLIARLSQYGASLSRNDRHFEDFPRRRRIVTSGYTGLWSGTFRFQKSTMS
ncbi:hypothetical protein F441_06270 [Phytophthora nicotianae CJ01A1]|uniref:Uncharacterized protein n=3 Tax=Phytophthora nicotianae TaxID=4792 RepID=V9FI71_PHYNI|nr:hypothetical protein F443_06266 [Phytophthora nicotianae P1569]ETP19858.1 hypothetical protein F441_06270 [Phytophthora nicotianae CJ01A1]ETP47806.1 hypothetical protein F442_06308 [Phytophthora nicotianae P10297]